MTLAPDERGYLIIDHLGATPRELEHWRQARHHLQTLGWTRHLECEALDVLTGPRSPLPAVQVHQQHILIGTWTGRSSSLAAVIGKSRDDEGLARACVSEGWGRYVLAWRCEDGRLAMLRDPSGALDCIWWRHGGLLLASDQPPAALEALFPEDLDVDWDGLTQIAESPALLGSTVPLKGLEPVLPGQIVLAGRRTEVRTVWRPVDFCIGNTPWDDDPDAMRRIVDYTVAQATQRHDRLVVEISGGLDSAIVGSSLHAIGHSAKGSYINFYGDAAEGDERAFATAAAELLDVPLKTIRKPVQALDIAALATLGQGVRPALHGVDVVYDASVADRLTAGGGTGLLTGQGGDSVFFQSPDPQVVIDRRRRRGIRGVEPGYWADVARWTRHSAWTIAGLALWPPGQRAASLPQHPWAVDGAYAPPAKAGQIQRLANSQLFWSDCLRARAGELIHPLLSQPVVEHCLAIPSDRLTVGARDRGLARIAFADRLPAVIVDRRDKGDLSQFYGRVVAASLDRLRPFLLDGLLVSHGILDRSELELQLTSDRLIWSLESNRHLLQAVLETWARRWADRVDARRRAKISSQPVENALI